MAYIAPDSDIYLLKGVPLDKDYNHTVLQTNATAQYNMFYAYRKYTFNDQSYQRAGKGKLRIAALADNLYDCNYLMFRNTAFGTKWFYAFIDSVEYINNSVTEVNYTIDVMQTWYFDYDLGSCFVEREHSLTDVIGDNLVPEDINPGELMVQQDWEFKFPANAPYTGTESTIKANVMYQLLVLYTPSSDNKAIKLGFVIGPDDTVEYDIITIDTNYRTTLINDTIMGCFVESIPIKSNNSTNIAWTRKQLSLMINALISAKCEIVKMIQVPAKVWYDTSNYDGTGSTLKFESTTSRTQSARNYDSAYSTFYLPKNKKMFTYPYRQLVVTNNSGQSANFKWEYFTSNSSGMKQATFKINGISLPLPEIVLFPTYYRGIDNDFENGLILNNFPTASWNENSFDKWWAQNRDSFVMGVLSSSVGTIASFGLQTKDKAKIGQSLNVYDNVSNTIGNVISKQTVPSQFYGEISSSTLQTVQNRVGFHFYDMGLEKSSAKIVDNYFTMFGYAVKQVKIPNVRQSGVTLRPHWNYVKTQACIIHAATGKGLPADDESRIASIYNNGITFWTTISEIGNYSLDNSPAS